MSTRFHPCKFILIHANPHRFKLHHSLINPHQKPRTWEREREKGRAVSIMGTVSSNCSTKQDEEDFMRARIELLEHEVGGLAKARGREMRAYEQHLVLFTLEEEGWKQERRRLDERIKVLEGEVAGRCEAKEMLYWRGAGPECVEDLRRDLAVEKWKQLYLDIKTELDDLIHRTRQGGRFCWEAEEGMIEGLRRELQDKEEAMEMLRSRIAELEKEAIRREREIDILRQSLRILGNTKRNRRRSHSRGALRL